MQQSFIDRYLNGECEKVWSELTTLGTSVHDEPYRHEAHAVAEETMARVNYNIDLIVERLSNLGYLFGEYPDGKEKVFGYSGPHNIPNQPVMDKAEESNRVEFRQIIPLSLKAFWEIVGDVDLIGYHIGWPRYSDPLTVYPRKYAEYEYSCWQNENRKDIGVKEFGISISPDIIHKNNQSGGEPYRIMIPNDSMDADLINERHHTTFVNYLRISFRSFGFAGIENPAEVLPKELLAISMKLKPI